MISLFKRLLKEEEGQGMVEYGLIIAMVSIVGIAAFGTLTDGLSELAGKIDTYLKETEVPPEAGE